MIRSKAATVFVLLLLSNLANADLRNMAGSYQKREKAFLNLLKSWENSAEILSASSLQGSTWNCSMLTDYPTLTAVSFPLVFKMPRNELQNTALVDQDHVPAKTFNLNMRGSLISFRYETIDFDDRRTMPKIEFRYTLALRRMGVNQEMLIGLLTKTDYTGKYPVWKSPEGVFLEEPIGAAVCTEQLKKPSVPAPAKPAAIKPSVVRRPQR